MDTSVIWAEHFPYTYEALDLILTAEKKRDMKCSTVLYNFKIYHYCVCAHVCEWRSEVIASILAVPIS